MSKQDWLVTPEEAQAFFLEAMRHGWAYGFDPKPNTPYPGFKELEYVTNGLRLVDTYHTTQDSQRSGGFTMMFWKDTPIWKMTYDGWYAEEAIPTLRAALRWSYDRNEFVGGRGPSNFNNSGMLYTNMPWPKSFLCFRGDEEIKDLESGAFLGTHLYSGWWLLE